MRRTEIKNERGYWKGLFFDILLFVFFMVFFLFSPDRMVYAGLPWESPLKSIGSSLSGPVAYTISLLGIIGSGATLVWGGEINDFIRTMIKLVLVISIIAFSSNILSGLFNMTSH